MPDPTREEMEVRARILEEIRSAVAAGMTIRLPAVSESSANPFAGCVGEYDYVFEGEDDLLHLAITRRDSRALSPEEGQAVVGWLLSGMPPGLVWIRPGKFSQHFYCGHDDLVVNVS